MLPLHLRSVHFPLCIQGFSLQILRCIFIFFAFSALPDNQLLGVSVLILHLRYKSQSSLLRNIISSQTLTKNCLFLWPVDFKKQFEITIYLNTHSKKLRTILKKNCIYIKLLK